MNLKRNWIFILSIFFFSSFSWAWGYLGHQASAEIAFRLLDKPTKQKVLRILKGQSMAAVSVWADAARAEMPEWKYTLWYHFEKVPDNMTYLQNLKRHDEQTRKNGGLIEALYIAEDYLRTSNNPTDRENALKFLIHFVADIHQPLHTGRIEDNSGNKIPIKWLGLDANLHQVWDSLILGLAHQDILDGHSYEEQIPIYADYLQTKFKNYRPRPEQFSRYDEWMHESMVPRDDAYKFKDLDEKRYTAKFSNVVDERVYLAALRIAYTINRILNTQPPVQADPLLQLRQSMIEIVGRFENFVSLRPDPNPVN